MPSRTAAPTIEDRARAFWWMVRLRAAAVAGVVLVLLVTGPALHLLPAGAGPALWVVAALLAAFDGALCLAGPARARWLTGFVPQILADCLALGALVHLAGGAENPFLPLFGLHVVSAAILLDGRRAVAVAALCVALIAAVVLGEHAGLLAHHCLRGSGPGCSLRSARLWFPIGQVAGMALVLLACARLTGELVARLRDHRERLVEAVGLLERDKLQLGAFRAEADRDRSELAAIIDCMTDAVVFADPSGRVERRNRRAVELEGALEGLKLDELFAKVRDSSGAHRLPALEHRGRVLEISCAPVRGEAGVALGLLLVARDVSEQVALQRRMMQEERISVAGRLASTVAHEINNPIGVIALYAEHAAARLPADSPVHEHLEIILRNASACRQIVGGLLSLSRPASTQRDAVDLRAACSEVARSLAPLAEKREVELRAGQEGGPLILEVDPTELRQLILNLALNALESTERGGHVFVGARPLPGEPSSAALEIRDDGAGISEAVRARIFEPFFTTKPTGTGLGLAVVHDIVARNGGSIEVDSTPARGATFRVILPLASGARPGAEAAS